ncbi:helix-turn-helix domain-containing protein [Iningainema tapete]|uniref:Helix-turn-helix transcriptional regulator n=1 Tax=Iningainema tapete BLCC-T55 TaxID=2748662 RepID=A0A8J6XXR8_9CYAN|nr:helix-turn-helix transcriptional regulator [Iningainema tapete]MBD2775003.1 helix-turn-helix transcriptional regulator [Iningainema tapete BLCC-T55]
MLRLKNSIAHNSNQLVTNIKEEFQSDRTAQLEKQVPFIGIKKFAEKLQLNYQQHPAKPRQFKNASLFSDGKTNIAALSLVLRGVAEVLSQKMDLSWKAEVNGTLSYEQEVEGGQGKIFYYVTDNSEPPQPETLAQEAALAAIDQFDPRACAIHLIYCALAASLDKPWEGNFVINHSQLLEYTGLVRRRDLCKHEQLSILYHLLRQPAQVLACITWPQQGEVGAFTVADLKIWEITIVRNFKTDKAGNNKLVGLKVIGQPGVWTKYFLNKSKYYCHTGIITKKTVQKLFSIGKQNAGAARMLIWLTFQIKPGIQDYVTGKTLIEIAYGADRVAIAQADRQLRRQLADDFETDLKVLQEVGWLAELETGPAWLIDSAHKKRPIGFWDELLNTRWHFILPTEVQERLTLRTTQPSVNNIQPPPGNVIREARKAKSWSREFFATIMGKSVSWVDAVETGHRKVSQKDLPKLFNILEL